MTNYLFDKRAAINCCKDCTAETGRSIGCHSTCEKYLEQKRQEMKFKSLNLSKSKRMTCLSTSIAKETKE